VYTVLYGMLMIGATQCGCVKTDWSESNYTFMS